MDLVPYLTIAQIEASLQGLALVAGAVAFACGLYQYSKAQAWKRHEFVAAEVRQFDSDPLARSAMLMIDWGTRNIALFPSHPDYSARFVLVTRPLLHTALVTHDKIGRVYTPDEAAIRDCFDSFFSGLERFEQFIRAGLVGASEFQPYLAYWIQSICEETNPELRRILNEYVAFYHFEGVASLFQRYGKQFGRLDASLPLGSSRYDVQDQYEEQVKTALVAQNKPSNERVEPTA
jgi:hypothetical protein